MYKTKKVKIEKTVLFRELRNLLIAAYYLGQSSGLEKKNFQHPDSVKERRNIIDILMHEI